MKKISIIIITYNRADDTLLLLRDIDALQYKEELLQDVILVNNASTEDYGSVKAFIAKNITTQFRFLDAPSNLGVAGGRNFAARHAEGSIFVFLDDDVAIEDRKFLQHVNLAFEKDIPGDRKPGVIGFKVKYYSTRQLQENAFPHKQFEAYKDKAWFLTSYYVGCAHAFSSEAWKAAGEYPADFFYGMEEYDLGYRVLQAGYAISYDGSVEIFHKESPLGRQPRPEKMGMMWVNKATVAWRYLPRIYFFTTAIAWSNFYLLKTRFNLSRYFSSWVAIFKIPFRRKRHPLNANVIQYLRSVDARLWY